MFEQLMISEKIWNEAIAVRSYDIEFDWFGIDNNGFIAVFSSFSRGFIPEIVKKSRLDYIKIIEEIENLLFKYTAQLVINSDGRFDDWIKYSKQGIIAFDYQEVHRIEKHEVYDLISKPNNLMTAEAIGINKKIIKKIPKFNMSFNSYSIKDSDLQTNLVTIL